MENDDLAFTFFNEINIIAQLSSNAFGRALPPGLSKSQFSVLNWFVRLDSVATPGRLSTAFMVTKGAMTNTLKKLHDKGLVVIKPDENSGRQKVVSMTPDGRRVRDQALKDAAPMMSKIIDHFSDEELKQNLPFLQELRKYLDEQRYQ